MAGRGGGGVGWGGFWRWRVVDGSCLRVCIPAAHSSERPTPSAFPWQVESASYENIALSLGVDSPSEILFATDSTAEAAAAAVAGWRVVLAHRPGNAALPETPDFAVVETMTDLLLV